jgi:hypothetical protein
MEARQHVEFTGVELVDGVELATPVEKTAAGLHTVWVRG